MAEQKTAPYLKHKVTGEVYPYHPVLAKDPNMEPCNSIPKPANKNNKPANK